MAHQHQISGIFWTPCLSLRVAKVFLWTSNTLQPPDLGEIYLCGSQNDTLLVPGSEPSWRELPIGPDPQRHPPAGASPPRPASSRLLVYPGSLQGCLNSPSSCPCCHSPLGKLGFPQFLRSFPQGFPKVSEEETRRGRPTPLQSELVSGCTEDPAPKSWAASPLERGKSGASRGWALPGCRRSARAAALTCCFAFYTQSRLLGRLPR